MPFSVGDHVKPIPGFDKPATNLDRDTKPYPSGVVTEVSPFGVGQKLRVGNSVFEYPSGAFEKVSTGDAP